jgi:hypothetical protein
MFRALLVHSQEVLHKRHLVYCMRVMIVIPSSVPSAACVAPSEDQQVMLETCRGP